MSDTDIFTEEERTVEKDWHIYLYGRYNIDPLAAVDGTDARAQLSVYDVIPESVCIHAVSFYFTGTFKEAYEAAQQRCDELNQSNLGEDDWGFERGSIMSIG